MADLLAELRARYFEHLTATLAEQAAAEPGTPPPSPPGSEGWWPRRTTSRSAPAEAGMARGEPGRHRLSALSLLLAMWIGPDVSVTVAASLWVLRVATVSLPDLAHGWLAAGMRTVWATSPGTVAVTLALLAAAVALSRRPIRRRGAWYRPVAW